MRWLGTIVALMVMYPCASPAHSPILTLRILSNGHVRFDGGPELDHRHLLLKINSLMRSDPRPDIRLLPSKNAGFQAISEVLKAFQETNYGPHLGFEGMKSVPQAN